MVLSRKCTKCSKIKPYSEFYKRKASADGLRHECKDCSRKGCMVYRKKNPEKYCNQRKKWRRTKVGKRSELNTRYKNKYDITIKEYDQMFDAQDGVCAICSKKETVKNQYGVKRLSIDHDHKTGKVRSLLCSRCNMKLGTIEGDINLTYKMLLYLNQKI